MNKGTEKEATLSVRFEKLVHAIEFFSQRFSLEDITSYIYEFTQKLLEVQECDVYVVEKGSYLRKCSMNHCVGEGSFFKEVKHDQSVYFHAGLMEYEFLQTMVPKEALTRKIHYAIPLIMDKSLYGMVLVGFEDKPDRNDLIVSEALMNLFSLSLTNFENYEKLDHAKSQLDAKVFNLFAINQASKALLSVLDIRDLSELSLSVFSELTQSRVTSLFLRDEISGQFHCEGVIDVFNKIKKIPMNFQRNLQSSQEIRVVIDWSDQKQRSEFQEAFSQSIDLLERFEPRYIVNLINDRELLGFVTLGNKVNQEMYERDVFELIESLASATYIAVSNAKHLQEIADQKKIIQDKFERLQRLNRLIKNMNSATHIQYLMELTLETIRISFGYKTSFFALYQPAEKTFLIEHALNLRLSDNTLQLYDELQDLLEGKMVVEYRKDDLVNLFYEVLDEEEFDLLQGLIMIPILFDGEEEELIGVIALLDVEQGGLVTEENILTLETIANHIAPVVKQLRLVEVMEKKYEKNMKLAFLEQLRASIEDTDYNDSPFYVIGLKSKRFDLFDTTFLTEVCQQYRYSFGIDNNHVFILAYTKEEAQRILNQHTIDSDTCLIEYPITASSEKEMLDRLSVFVYGDNYEGERT